jgi:rhomboid protease GluP
MHQPSPDIVGGVPPRSRLSELPFVTALACGAALLITIGITAQSTQPSGMQLAEWGYLPAERIWDGALWALVSSAFVHVAPWHLLFNVYWLWRLGGPVERTLGSFNFFAFIIVVAFFSSASQLALSNETGIGASGIVYGLFGLMWRSRHQVHRFSTILGTDTPGLFFIWLFACLIATRSGFVNIGNAAHFGGLLFGILVAEWRFREIHRRPAIFATLFLVLASGIAALINPWSRPWLEHAAMRLHRDGQYLRANLTYERSLSYGADSAWAFHNLALTYYALGDTTGYQQAVRSLRILAPGQADSLELRLGSTSSSLPGS